MGRRAMRIPRPFKNLLDPFPHLRKIVTNYFLAEAAMQIKQKLHIYFQFINFNFILSAAAALLLLSACFAEKPVASATPPAPWVKTVAVGADSGAVLTLSGTVRARHETPVAFQVGGRITARHVDAGQEIRKGAALFRLDARDLEEAVRAAEAEQAAARAALETAQAEVARSRKLRAQNFIGQQALERAELAQREMHTRLDGASARLRQARNALGYADLRAQTGGVLVSVSAEAGQVVAAGQPLAVIAREGARELEVFFPDGVTPPHEGRALLPDGQTLALSLREVAGAADPQSRTWRARYRTPKAAPALPLGSLLRVDFTTAATAGAGNGTLEVPLAALDERGGGARVWRVVDGAAQPLPVQVAALLPETARIRAELPPGSRIIALGTHLLQPGMAVRELKP
jgi:RND family efflux transporter MFP subunit